MSESEARLRACRAEAEHERAQAEPLDAHSVHLEQWEARYMQEVNEKKKQAKQDEGIVTATVRCDLTQAVMTLVAGKLKQLKRLPRVLSLSKKSYVNKLSRDRCELLGLALRRVQLVRQSEVEAAKEHLRALQHKQTLIRKEHKWLLQLLPELQQRQDSLTLQKADLKSHNGLTPRPDWTQVGDEVGAISSGQFNYAQIGLSLHGTSSWNVRMLSEHYKLQASKLADLKVN